MYMAGRALKKSDTAQTLGSLPIRVRAGVGSSRLQIARARAYVISPLLMLGAISRCLPMYIEISHGGSKPYHVLNSKCT